MMFKQTSEFEAAFGVQPQVRADLAGVSDAGHTEAPSRAIADKFRHAVAGIAAVFKQWRLRGETRRILSSLDDRMLKDLGLTRSDLGAYGGADDIRWDTIYRWR
jgi:uncharacterized protein YjiS (DUF1127 family)